MQAPRPGWLLLAALSVGFHLYLIFSGLLPNLVSRPIHLALALPWVLIFLPSSGRAARISGYLLCISGVLACVWIVLNRDLLVEQYGSLQGTPQYLLAAVLIVVVLEMARRAIKLALPTVAVIALGYGMLGQYIPGELGHPGIPIDSFLGTLTSAEGGIWGQLTGVSVNVVAVFVMLGAFVGAGEGGAGFMALAVRVAGRYRAGAAKVSVVSSALFGSISGSASANVASTGAITLPTMKRLGYPAAFAAAVEAVASTGGQIMPPLMGAGAFVMVELLRTRYETIMAAAIVPALLFFWAVWAGVDRFALNHDLRGMSVTELPGTRELLTTVPFFLAPFTVLLVTLFYSDYTPQFAAGLAIGVSAVLLAADRNGLSTSARFRQRLAVALVESARQIAAIAAIIVCAGIVIGVLNMTGLGIKVTSLIIGISAGNLGVALGLTAVACLILGMEVPTTAAYIICISVAGPALQELGLDPLRAHLFVFWYALLSTITPPVCGTVFIASGMANAPWVATALQAMRLGLGLYIVPLGFIANAALIDPLNMPLLALLATLKVGAGLWLISTALNQLNAPPWRIVTNLGLGLGLIFALPLGEL